MTDYKKYLTRGLQSSLEKIDFDNGVLRFITDTGRLFLDLENERIEITDFVKEYTEEEIINILTPLPKIYYATDTHNLLIYNGEEWNTCCTNYSDESNHSINADNAINASTADYAKIAGNSISANTAINADTATYAVSSKSSNTANSATSATNASTADYANKSLQDGNSKQINTTYAPLASPIFTGIPTVPTPTSTDNSKQIANTEFVSDAIVNAVSKITQFNTSVVDVLPTTGVNGTIYFKSNGSSEENNIYDEYIWVSNKFEKIGSTKISLSGYLNEITTSGTGNAITGAKLNDNVLEFTKGATFLTAHPSVSKSSSTATETPSAGSTIEMVDSVVTDSFGHITSYRKKTVTLPNSVNKATNADTATYAKTAGSATSATNASTATYATSAGNATSATNASTANYSKTCASASSATYATKAGTANSSTNASTSAYAVNSSTSTYSKSAANATSSDKTSGINDDADMDFGSLDD